jgi:hypothetical protein
VAPKARSVSIGHQAKIVAINTNLTIGRSGQSTQDVQQRRLAGTGGTHDGDHLSFLDAQVDVAQEPRARGATAYDLLYGLQINQCRHANTPRLLTGFDDFDRWRRTRRSSQRLSPSSA